MEIKLLEFIKDIQTTLYEDKQIKDTIRNYIIHGEIIYISERTKDAIFDIIRDIYIMFDKNLDHYTDVYDHGDVLDALKKYIGEDKESKLIRLSLELSRLDEEYTALIKEIESESEQIDKV